MKRYIRSTSDVDTFMKFHEDLDNYRNKPEVFDEIYEILDKYGDESEDVDVVFKRATPEDQRKLMALIQN